MASFDPIDFDPDAPPPRPTTPPVRRGFLLVFAALSLAALLVYGIPYVADRTGYAWEAGRSRAASQALARLDEADAILAATDDRLSTAIAGLARARVYEAIGRTDAEAVLGDARAALLEVGAAGDGWDTAFRLATGQATSV